MADWCPGVRVLGRGPLLPGPNRAHHMGMPAILPHMWTAEEVLALQPDLVLASTYLAPATGAALSSLGLRLEQVGVAATVEESRA